MEINVWGIILLLIAWACAGIATGFGFYLYSKKKDYEMTSTDKDYLLVNSVTSAIAVALTTIITLMIIFMGRDEYKKHASLTRKLMVEKIELENELTECQEKLATKTQPQRKLLENPIPLRKGRNGRPLIT